MVGVIGSLYYFEHNALKIIEEKEIITSDIIESQIAQIAEISSVKYNYRDVLQMTNHRKINGMKVPFTEKSFIIVYNGYVKAGVDLTDVEVTVDDGKYVTVTIPNARILDNVIDEKTIDVVDETSSMFNELKMDDYFEVISAKKDVVAENLIEEGFLDEANKHVELLIKGILNVEEIEGVSVVFRNDRASN